MFPQEELELHEQFCVGCGRLLTPQEVQENGDVCDDCIAALWQDLLDEE